MSNRMFVSVTCLPINKRNLEICEYTNSFESTVDHNDLADLIGRAVMRATNAVRDQGLPVDIVSFLVKYEHE